ncbi:LacI family transcriptional regulator [Ktedonobacter sp. SOSP1-52]|uniref:LacI family DNA-binding transcriptional regulator n=1 Tax=Ktedonobacter sp. SOSP1-52 TaxID=2778366 RepID=UPI0019151CA1|nr:LacI family DNA-binding transcriptional regulator [Ktedonobacter sp. SOSP1-52]GHO61653.1 LacI family transcriptional regulator [Ktedonobacter sp. SOSP1-52]
MSSEVSNESVSRQMQSVTIHDVAREAGVSIGTVSKALNGQGKLKSETRERIQEVAARLGFRPNMMAQNLLRGRSYTVGLLTTDSYGRFSIPLMKGIEDALGTAQILVFLCDARDDAQRERQYIETLLSKRVDGIIVTSRRTDPRPAIDVGQTGIPVLYAYTQVKEGNALCILPDDEQGARLAIEHLVEHGRRHIGHIMGPSHFESTQLRQKAVRQVLKEAGLATHEQRFLSGPWQESWGYNATQFLITSDPQVDAIFCGNDQIARGTIDMLRELGRKVPDDIAVIGFDNWEIIAASSRPPLTTVDLDIYHLGQLAGSRLLTMIDGSRETGVIRHPCHLVIRASCGSHDLVPIQ